MEPLVHILWALVVTLVLQTGEIDHRTKSSYVRYDDCMVERQELQKHIADLNDGIIPRGVWVECIAVPHDTIW